MTTNTDGAMPELPGVLRNFAQAVDRIAFEMPAPNPYTPRLVQMASDVISELNRRAEIQQAAGAVPEGLVPCPTCDQTGLVTEIGDKYFRRAHCPSCNGRGKVAPPKQQPVHLAACEGSGVTQPQPLSTCTVDAIYQDRNHALLWARALIHPAHDAVYKHEPYWTDFCWWNCMHYSHRGEPCHSYAWKIDPEPITNIVQLEVTHWLPRPPAPRNDAATGQIKKEGEA